jgi:5-(hydroxymethyl)furfural/furfural oxidase
VEEHDVLIVGGGAAGCVLAARLSEDPRRRVLLIEAGIDTLPGTEPADIRDSYPRAYSNPGYFWPRLTARGSVGSSEAAYLQARIVGGGSSVMGLWALRGMPCDYDAWREAGALGWGWADVVPSFRRLERDFDCTGPLHGSDGPIPIKRHCRDVWPGFARGLLAAATRRGLDYREDINGDFGDGVFPVPVTCDAGGRVSAAMGYLTADVRRRPNLTVLTSTVVRRLLFREGRAVGVQTERDGVTARAGEIILSAGAIHSPTLLLRSGVGPADELSALGIVPVADVPGVGRSLQNHCVINLATPLVAAARQSPGLRTYGLACARVTSGDPDGGPGDLLLQFIAKTGDHPLGDRLGVVGAALYRPLSRGSVRLASGDPAMPPVVDFRLLDHASDRSRLAVAVGLCLTLLGDTAVCPLRGDVFAVMPNSFVRRLNQPGWSNDAMSAALALLVDTPSRLRRAVLAQAGQVFPEPLSSISPEDLLQFATPIFHPAGTCAMGRPENPLAVVDPDCRVRGVEGLRVVDASVMPLLPAGNTCLPTMMIAEHAVPNIIRSAKVRFGR